MNQKTILKTSFLLMVCFASLFFCLTSLAQSVGGATVQTNSASSIYSNQATLNGNLSIPYISTSNYVYFQYGTDTNYGNATNQQILSSSGSFSQVVTNLSYNVTYHFRAVALVNGSTIYGQDMAFYVNYNNNNNNGSFYVQTNSPTSLQNNSATLNGYLYNNNSYNTTSYVYFQYGTDTNYGTNTFQQTLNYQGSFFQQLNNLFPNTMYHFRAVAQNNGSTVYGQDMTFIINGSNYYNGNNYYGNGTLSVTKQVMNLSSGNLNWSSSVNAKPGDVLSFAITMQAYGQQIDNVFVRDNLPTDLIYRGNLTMNASQNYSGNPTSGINIGTIPSGGVEIIAYQVQVAPAASFAYGSTTINNNVTVTSSEGGTETASASAIVNNQVVYGASTVATGLTNNPITDSFFLPLLFIILGSWLYFSGNIYKFADWLGKYIN